MYPESALLATIEGGTTTYHHQDHLSVRVNTDTNGTLAGEQGHYPFGEFWYSSSTTTKWRFTSYERDAESGNDYAIFRYHSNRLGRFLTPDPIAGSTANPQSLNRYAYVQNDPTNRIDPLGLACYWWVEYERIQYKDGTYGPKKITRASFLGCGRDPEIQHLLPIELRQWDDLHMRLVRGDVAGVVIDPEGLAALDPSTSGPEQAAINAALSKVQAALAADPNCAAFLASKGTDPLQRLRDLAGFIGHATIVNNGDPYSIAAVTGGLVEGQAITINRSGAFFAGKVDGNTLSVNQGKIQGGTPAAQGFILLHELGHSTGVLQHDLNVPKAGRENDRAISENCSKALKILGRRQ
jgi:RHS repeat-associated protein